MLRFPYFLLGISAADMDPGEDTETVYSMDHDPGDFQNRKFALNDEEKIENSSVPPQFDQNEKNGILEWTNRILQKPSKQANNKNVPVPTQTWNVFLEEPEEMYEHLNIVRSFSYLLPASPSYDDISLQSSMPFNGCSSTSRIPSNHFQIQDLEKKKDMLEFTKRESTMEQSLWYKPKMQDNEQDFLDITSIDVASFKQFEVVPIKRFEQHQKKIRPHLASFKQFEVVPIKRFEQHQKKIRPHQEQEGEIQDDSQNRKDGEQDRERMASQQKQHFIEGSNGISNTYLCILMLILAESFWKWSSILFLRDLEKRLTNLMAISTVTEGSLNMATKTDVNETTTAFAEIESQKNRKDEIQDRKRIKDTAGGFLSTCANEISSLNIAYSLNMVVKCIE